MVYVKFCVTKAMLADIFTKGTIGSLGHYGRIRNILMGANLHSYLKDNEGDPLESF